MALPAGYDIGLALATSGITSLLEARLRLGRADPGADGAIDPESPPLNIIGVRMTSITLLAAPDLGPAECWLVIPLTGDNSEIREISIGLTLTLVTDATGTTTLRLVFREALVDSGPWDRSSLGELIDEIEGSPLIDVTSLLTDISTALGVTLPATTTVSTGLLAGNGSDAEPAIAVFVSTNGRTTFPDGVASFVHPRRHIALAFGGSFVETSLVPAAIVNELGTLPAEIEPGIELRDLAVTVETDQLRVAGSAAHVQDPGIGTVVFGGPVRLWYSQPTQKLTVEVNGIDAAMPISWLLLLLGPLGLFLLGWIDTALDAAVRAAVRGTTGGLLGGIDLDSLAADDNPPTRTVLRWVAIEDGSLVIGLSLHAGLYRANVVGASGGRRLRLVQLDDDDILAVADAVALIDAGVLRIPGVHPVHSTTTGRVWLRADPDSSEGNNLRALPPVDTGLIPPAELPPR